MLKICLVIPEISHIENNDVPLSFYYLAQVLSKDKDVTVLYTSTSNNLMCDYWKNMYTKLGVRFEMLSDANFNPFLAANDLFFRNSYAVYKRLEAYHFDRIYFADFYAAGFHTIQAKKTTSLFDRTVIAVMMLGSSEYLLDCYNRWCDNPVFDMRQQYAERYCCKNADILISASDYMFSWARSRNWALAEKRCVAENGFDRSKTDVAYKKAHCENIIFWGNHEDLEGIRTFCHAVIDLSEHGYPLQRISFMFNAFSFDLEETANFVDQLLGGCHIEFVIRNSYDLLRSLTYIRDEAGLAVLMSVVGDDLIRLTECINNEIPFLVAASGPSSELLDERLLFEPTVSGLAGKLKHGGVIWHRPTENKKGILCWGINDELFDMDGYDKAEESRHPKVSVCVAYYNHGKYLPMLLASIEANAYSNFEVVVVNDGSTDPDSIAVFEEMAGKYTSPKYRFFSKENEFVGKTRNYAVGQSGGEYIIFADADDILAPDMIENYVIGIMKSGCDCLSGYMHYFNGESGLDKSTMSQAIYSPTGPVLELALFENCIGGVNMIIKKRVFIETGGFGSERLCYEDWRYLVKLVLKGYDLDVIPLCLYYYRILPDSINRSKNEYNSKSWFVSAFYDEIPMYMRYLVRNFCIPSWDMWREKLCSNESETEKDNRVIDSMCIFAIIKYLIKRIFKRLSILFKVSKWNIVNKKQSEKSKT